MSFSQREDYNGPIAARVKLADEKGLSPNNMISILSKGDKGIDEYFSNKKKKPVEEHKSILDDFQL